ncbi:MAG: HDOD domain-containing protein [Planctomycetota bacterium]
MTIPEPAQPRTDLKSIVSSIRELPTLPQVVMTIMRLVDDPSSSARDINRVMSQDPALAGKVLRLVNSAYYGLPKKVVGLGHAIVILGFNTIKSVALSASIFDLFRDVGKAGRLDKKQFWRHSIGCACVARMVARMSGKADAETAFAAALLHDIGKLILDQHARPVFGQVLAEAQARGLLFHEAERELLETNHAEIGFWLTQQWNFPPELANTIRDHHTPAEEIPITPLVALVAIANQFCESRQLGASANFRVPIVPPEAYATLNITPERVEGMTDALVEEILDAEEFMNLAAS